VGRAGWCNIYVPTAEVTHLGGHSTRRVAEQMLLEHHRSTYRYLTDRHPGPLHAPLRLALRAGLSARAELLRRRLHPAQPPPHGSTGQ
jgi:N-acetylglucosaminyl-diphospho-decaprenol L-rhamnosyltransferase